MYLLKARREHKKFIEAFVQRYGLSDVFSELADSAFREANRGVIETWDLLLKGWETSEKDASKKVGITVNDFNWVSKALIDPKKRDIHTRIAEELVTMQQ